MVRAVAQRLIIVCGALAMVMAFHVDPAASQPDDGQVIEGEVEVVNVRETDPTLGPLVGGLVALGATALVATIGFWFWTRPSRWVAGPSTANTSDALNAPRDSIRED